MKAKFNIGFHLLIGIFLCQIAPSTAQMVVMPQFIDGFEALDSTRFVVKYSLDFVANPDKPETIDTDIVVLEIGSQVSKSYSYNLFKHDSIATASKGSGRAPMLQIAVPPIEVFKNYPVGKNTVVHRSPLSGPIFLYEDEVSIHWEILPERKKVSGYLCQKAIATFRGRTWEAWFTNQIPVSDGPWKFQGLPGLIMQVSDDQNHFRYTCIGLSRETVHIKKWKWRYERTSREKVNNLLTRYAERPYVVGPQIGIRFGNVSSSDKDKSAPYNPLELE